MSEIGYPAEGLGDTVDKHGQRISLGDQVHIVYGGVGHHMEVERISVHPETRLVQVHGSITVSVPAVTALRIEPQSLKADAEDPNAPSTTSSPKKSPTKEK